MIKLLAALSLSATLGLAFSSGWLLLELRRQSARAAVSEGERQALARHLQSVEAKLAKLEEELAGKSRLAEELKAALAAHPPAAEEAPSGSGEEAEKGRRPAETGAVRSIQLRSPGEADGLMADLLSRGDLEGLLLLAADLLGRGEEGYEKLLELSGPFDKELRKGRDSGLFKLWDNPEVLLGPLFRLASQHDEDLLRFLIYLEGRPADPELPKFVREMRKGLSEEMASPLVGFYDGSDPDLLADLTGMYGRRLSTSDPASGEARSAIQALGQIRTEEAYQLLLEALRTGVPAPLQKTLVQSLALQRNRQALPALRQLLENTTDTELADFLRAAIRYLE